MQELPHVHILFENADWLPPLVSALEAEGFEHSEILVREGIEIAGIEFVEDAEGRRFTYDINGTTNYNQALGDEIGVDGMGEVVRYLKDVVVAGLE